MTDLAARLARKWSDEYWKAGNKLSVYGIIDAAIREALKPADAVARAAEEVKAVFHPKGPGYGTCAVCTLAGGKHSGSCCIGHVVDALTIFQGGGGGT